MASIFTFSDDYLDKLRNRIKNDIASVRYKSGNTWYTESVQSASVLSDGTIKIQFVISQAVSNISVIEIYDYNGDKIGEKSVSITYVAGSGVSYIIQLSLFQIAENSDLSGAYDAIE